MNFDHKHLFAVIMAGGRGERFWPAGRRSRPKQLLALSGSQTMIEETVQRLFPLILPENLLVITNQAYVRKIQDLLPVPPENVIGEPEGRDTAPCVALATALVRRRDPDATMILLPADHVIRPAKDFQNALLESAVAAQQGALLTFGITPTYPATGYGYLHAGEDVAEKFRNVLEFREKPDKGTAEQFFRDGSYLWNSGIFIWRADVISAAFQKHAPALSAKLEAWSCGADYTADFSSCEKISIDYAIMEKAEKVWVKAVSFYWNDIGSWSALKTLLPADDSGNAVKARFISLDAFDNVVMCDDDTLICAVNVNNLAIIKSGNGLLVCPLANEQRVKELVKRIGENAGEYL